MKWRLIEQQAYGAAMNMAIDQSICESAALEKGHPTIRFYKWLPSSVSIGAYQSHDDIDFEACKRTGIQAVRRITGGRAVFHDKADFTYSVTAPLRIFNYSIDNAYSQICSWIINALREIGIDAELRNKNDIVVAGRKISGNAAKAMEHGIYLQHGTLVYDIDYGIMPKIMRVEPRIIKEKATSVLEHTKISQRLLYQKLKSSFIRGKEIGEIGLSEPEMKRAESLALSKYSRIALPKDSFSKSAGACYVVHGN